MRYFLSFLIVSLSVTFLLGGASLQPVQFLNAASAQQQPSATQSCLEIAKAITQILAFLGAAVFFGYKAITGYLIVNVSLSVKVERVRGKKATDYLSIAATLKKGSHGSLELHDARTKVSWDGGSEERELIGFHRLSFSTEQGQPPRKRVIFDTASQKAPLLRLAPDEEATFSALIEVPSSTPCIVQIAITGIRTKGFRVGQWRTSVISLPCDDRPPKSAS